MAHLFLHKEGQSARLSQKEIINREEEGERCELVREREERNVGWVMTVKDRVRCLRRTISPRVRQIGAKKDAWIKHVLMAPNCHLVYSFIIDKKRPISQSTNQTKKNKPVETYE